MRLLDKRGKPLWKPQPLHVYTNGRWRVIPGPVAERIMARIMKERLNDLMGIAGRLEARRSVKTARETDRRLREAFEAGRITVGMADDSAAFMVDPSYSSCRRLLESRRK